MSDLSENLTKQHRAAMNSRCGMESGRKERRKGKIEPSFFSDFQNSRRVGDMRKEVGVAEEEGEFLHHPSPSLLGLPRTKWQVQPMTRAFVVYITEITNQWFERQTNYHLKIIFEYWLLLCAAREGTLREKDENVPCWFLCKSMVCLGKSGLDTNNLSWSFRYKC